MDFIKKKDVVKSNNEKKISKKEFLISEIQRYYRENNKSPTRKDIQPKNGYSNGTLYKYYFGSWNKALEIAGLEVNQKHQTGTLNGNEICLYCGKHADEISNHVGWLYHDNVRYCMKHGQHGKTAYVKGILDINSKVGHGRAGEICVVKALKIGDEYDCNKLSCGHSFDMYNDEYGKIDVKTSVLSNKNNVWNFIFGAKKVADTYICIGMSLDIKYVEHVWVVPNIDGIRNLQAFGISNGNLALRNHKKWEVDVKLYNDAWKEMLNNYTDGKCKVFSKNGD